MKITVCLPILEGYTISYDILDKIPGVSTLNTTGHAQDLIHDAVKKASAANVYMKQFYAHLQKEQPCIDVDVNLHVNISRNYNGYTNHIHAKKCDDVISLEEYQEWKQDHVAHWSNGTWHYERKPFGPFMLPKSKKGVRRNEE